MDTDEEIHRQVIDRVIDMGGEVFDVAVDHGVVRLHGRIGMREDIPLIEHLLYQVDGVTGVEAWFVIGGERGSAQLCAQPSTAGASAGPVRG